MRLMIRKKFFDQIVYGNKRLELRDAHITFVCEETGRMVRVVVDGVVLYSRDASMKYLKQYSGVDEKLFDELFEDNRQIAFSLGEVGKVQQK